MEDESVYTVPSAWCPRPDFWHSPDEQATEHEVTVLVGAFVRALQPDFCVETGTYHAHTALAIGAALRLNKHGQLVTIEANLDRARAAAKVLRGSGFQVVVHPGSSLDYEPRQPIDFAWLDSEPELRVPEFNHFRPWFHPGTIVGFHDTAPHKGTWSDEIGQLEGTSNIRLRTPRGVTFVQVH